MRRFAVFILFLVLFIVLTVPVMAECTEKLSVDERSLTESQKWWEPDMSPYIQLWDPFTPVELPDQTWFRVFELPGNAYALFEYKQSGLVMSFLIPGEETALLWDTGLGIGNIRACAEELTDIPIIVLNSHSHPGPLYALLEDSSLSDCVESMKKIEYVIAAGNIQWIYGSHNGIVPGTELFFEAAAFLDDVQDGNNTAYTIAYNSRVYEIDPYISVYLSQE